MFDKFNCRLSIRDRSATLSRDNILQKGWHGVGASLVEALKADPGIFIGGQERHCYICACQESKSLIGRRSIDCALISLIHNLSRYSITMVD
jgi:hypothetical protein